MRLKHQLAVVTGGAAGIGKGIALRLAEEGADVVIADIDEAAAQDAAQQVQSLGRQALAVRVDVARKSDVERMVATAQELGRIDILVNNAGAERITHPFQVEEDEWDQILAVNLKGAFLCSQAVAKAMTVNEPGVAAQARRGGKIVNLGSIAGIAAPRNGPHYSASKAGLHALTRQLAREFAEYQINVNAVAPGIIRNGLSTRHSLADAARSEALERSIPWGRLGAPRDIANAVVFLASDEADYITGVVLVVDGGYLLVTP